MMVFDEIINSMREARTRTSWWRDLRRMRDLLGDGAIHANYIDSLRVFLRERGL